MESQGREGILEGFGIFTTASYVNAKKDANDQIHKFFLRCLGTITFKLKAMNQYIFYQIISKLFNLYFIFTSTQHKFSWTCRCKFFLPFVWPFSARFIRQRWKNNNALSSVYRMSPSLSLGWLRNGTCFATMSPKYTIVPVHSSFIPE